MHAVDTAGDTILRFKDVDTCVQQLKNHAQNRMYVCIFYFVFTPYYYIIFVSLPYVCAICSRCMVTRAVYSQVEASNLHVSNTTEWNVTSCRPTFRRDQIANGLATIPGVSAVESRRLAARIIASKFPASIEDVKHYCCKNFCIDCKGSRLYGDVQVLHIMSYMHCMS